MAPNEKSTRDASTNNSRFIEFVFIYNIYKYIYKFCPLSYFFIFLSVTVGSLLTL